MSPIVHRFLGADQSLLDAIIETCETLGCTCEELVVNLADPQGEVDMADVAHWEGCPALEPRPGENN